MITVSVCINFEFILLFCMVYGAVFIFFFSCFQNDSHSSTPYSTIMLNFRFTYITVIAGFFFLLFNFAFNLEQFTLFTLKSDNQVDLVDFFFFFLFNGSLFPRLIGISRNNFFPPNLFYKSIIRKREFPITSRLGNCFPSFVISYIIL